MKLNTREAIIGIITYRVLKHMVARKLTTKGGIVATKKKSGYHRGNRSSHRRAVLLAEEEGELGRALSRGAQVPDAQGPDLVRPRRRPPF